MAEPSRLAPSTSASVNEPPSAHAYTRLPALLAAASAAASVAYGKARVPSAVASSPDGDANTPNFSSTTQASSLGALAGSHAVGAPPAPPTPLPLSPPLAVGPMPALPPASKLDPPAAPPASPSTPVLGSHELVFAQSLKPGLEQPTR